MTKVESIERSIQRLSEDELADFRRWFAAFDVAAWHRQFEGDARAGKLAGFAERALREHAVGRTTRV